MADTKDPPVYMNEHVVQRNRLPSRAYFLPAEHLSLAGKWRFYYAPSPLDPEPEPVDDGAWDLIHVPGEMTSSLFRSFFQAASSSALPSLQGQKSVDDCCHQH